MSDGIIDLAEYLRRRGGGTDEAHGTFALWGAEGERSRFALPLWRIAYLASAHRGGIVWHEVGDASTLHPFLVLDLDRDPPRLEFGPSAVGGLEASTQAPQLEDRADGSMAVYLGEGRGRSWYLVAEGPEGRAALGARAREDVLFLAGECAGLLFLRDFAADEGQGEE